MSQPALLERDRELDALQQALTNAAEGRGSLVLVEGPAGMGKTRLLAEMAARAAAGGFLVCHGRGGEMEREMPFGVARQLFESLVQHASEADHAQWLSGTAARALVALGLAPPEAPETDAFTAINGLYWLVANLSETKPVALVIDDAHWGDSDSLRFTSFLGRRVTDHRIFVALGARTGEADEPTELKALRMESSVMRLEQLSERSVHELIATHAGKPPTLEFSRACAAATAGNPFLVLEIVRELGSGRKLGSTEAASIAGIAPENVARSVLFRLGRFGDDAISLARAIAVLGRAPQLRHAASLAGLSDEQALSVCDRLYEAEILAPGLPIDFVHPLVRQAIYAEQPEGQRSKSHRTAAEILSGMGAGPIEVAAHLLLTAPNGDQWVVARLREAATAAISEGGHESARTYLERALAEPPDDSTPILLVLGVALVEVDPFEAPIVLARALDHAADPRARLDVLRQLVWANISTGNLIDAANRCDEALAVASETEVEQRLALEAQGFFMRVAAMGLDAEMTEHIHSVAAGLTGKTPGERVARQALAIERFASCAPVDEVADLCLPFPEPPWEIADGPSPVPFAAAKLLAWSGRWDEARRELARWYESVHDVGRLIASSASNSFLSEVERLSGHLIEAEALARTAWEIADAAGRFSAFGWSAWMNLAASLLARGDLDEFKAVVGGFDLSAGPLEVPLNPWPIEVRAQLRVTEGDLVSAVDDFLAFGAALEGRVGWLNPAYPPWRQEATELLATLGRTAEAKELISLAEERAIAFGAPHCVSSVLRARSFVEPRKRALDSLRASVEAIKDHGPPHELARSLLELGAGLRRDGQRTEAKRPLERALELTHRCGAGALEERVREELRAAGSRPRRAYRSGVEALTASEFRIAKLAAAGLNNREIAERLFVTRRTVETHLTHAYEKLGIEGRADLALVLPEQEAAAS